MMTRVDKKLTQQSLWKTCGEIGDNHTDVDH